MLVGEQEELFEQWVQQHKGVIIKVVRANAANTEDQNDLFQEIALQVWRSIPTYQCRRAKVSTWIYRVALNASSGGRGAEPWPKLFRNMRASRETELTAEYPLHVVCAWIGNSPAVAQAHYLQVTDADYQRAAENKRGLWSAGVGATSG